jgi:hypothetical protein
VKNPATDAIRRYLADRDAKSQYQKIEKPATDAIRRYLAERAVKSQYQEIVYRKLGLSEGGHEIGTTRYIDLPEHVLYSICARRLNIVDQTLFDDPDRDETWCWRVRQNYFLLYPLWLDILKTIKNFTPHLWTDTTLPYAERRKAIVECYFRWDLWERGKYEPTFAGWKKYLEEASPRFWEFLQKEIPVRVNSDDFLHVYCVAGSRSGKTEMLKSMAYQIVKDKDSALVWISPDGTRRAKSPTGGNTSTPTASSTSTTPLNLA